MESRSVLLRWLEGTKDALLIVSAVAVPIVVANIGAEVNATMKESENRIRYVELAISQLRSPPSAETTALRDWAVELLDAQSPVKLTPEAKKQLKSYALPVSINAVALGGAAESIGSATGGIAVGGGGALEKP